MIQEMTLTEQEFYQKVKPYAIGYDGYGWFIWDENKHRVFEKESPEVFQALVVKGQHTSFIRNN